MNLHDVLQSDSEDLSAILIRDFNPVGQAEMAFADLAAGEFANGLLGTLLCLAHTHQFGAFGIERDLVAVNMEEKAGHTSKTLTALQRSGKYCCSSSFRHPSSCIGRLSFRNLTARGSRVFAIR